MILERIDLRTIRRQQILKDPELNVLLANNGSHKQMEIVCYIHETVPTDLSIHIMHHQSANFDVSHGNQIKKVLERWGLIHYSLWRDQKHGE